MSDNLPAVPGVAFKDRPTAVQVVSRGDAPAIVQRMRRVHLADDTVESEKDRYSNLTVLNPNEKAAAAAYDALSDGRVLIDLHETLLQAHIRGETGRMRLAIGHPSMKKIYMRRFWNQAENDTVIDFASTYRKRKALEPFYSLHFDERGGRTDRWRTYTALTPPIPAEIRQRHENLATDKKYLLLWEPQWSIVDEHEPRPPVFDPALLYQVSGAIYSVSAVWDLTPVEAAALRPGPRF